MSDPVRFSPLDGALAPLNPIWGEVQSMRVADRFGEASFEKEQVGNLALCDVSVLVKFGVKGPDAAQWLRESGLVLPESLHGWRNIEGEQGIIVKNDRDEFFLEEGHTGSKVRDLIAGFGSGKPGVCRIERQEAGILLSGSRVGVVISQTCGHDFEAEGQGYVLTRVAGVSTAVLPYLKDRLPVFRLWCPPSLAIYIWNELMTIVLEEGGGVVGFDAARECL